MTKFARDFVQPKSLGQAFQGVSEWKFPPVLQTQGSTKLPKLIHDSSRETRRQDQKMLRCRYKGPCLIWIVTSVTEPSCKHLQKYSQRRLSPPTTGLQSHHMDDIV